MDTQNLLLDGIFPFSKDVIIKWNPLELARVFPNIDFANLGFDRSLTIDFDVGNLAPRTIITDRSEGVSISSSSKFGAILFDTNNTHITRRIKFDEVDPIDHQETEHSATPLLSVADFDGDGKVDLADIKDILSRYKSTDGDDRYHPLYDMDADGDIDKHDIIKAVSTIGEDVPLLDQQIARATQATMKYYGSKGLENAIADGYIPITQEAKGHGTHYANLSIFLETKNSEELDISHPVGLNYDEKGNLLAVFYLREPLTQQATPENPLAGILVDPANDFPPTSSFDTLSESDWHQHQSTWTTNFGNLNNPESVYFEEDVPINMIASRIEQTQFQFYPESNQFYSPKVWMLHGWFHSFNPNGTFAITNPNVALYAVEELGVHGEHYQEHQEDSDPLIAGTDEDDDLFGTDRDDRINGFGGEDRIDGGLGNDLIWGGQGNDLLKGEGGDDMVYGGPGNDLIYGNAGNDRLFGGTENDIITGGEGDDLLRGSLGYDLLTGNEGSDSFVLASGEGTDIITDLELEFDTIVLYAGVTTENISIDQIDDNTALGFNNETLAILIGINADDLMAARDDVFLVA